MAKSVEEQLSDIESAMDAVVRNGQRITVKDRDLWRADLSALDKRADRLERKAARQARGGLRAVRIVPL